MKYVGPPSQRAEAASEEIDKEIMQQNKYFHIFYLLLLVWKDALHNEIYSPPQPGGKHDKVKR